MQHRRSLSLGEIATGLGLSWVAALSTVALLPAYAHAEQPAPIAADVAHLGAVSAITYYTEEQDGFRVVTTIQDDSSDTATPVRFVTTLQAGQKAMFSALGAAPGAPGWTLELVREGNHLVVHHPTEKPDREAR